MSRGRPVRLGGNRAEVEILERYERQRTRHRPLLVPLREHGRRCPPDATPILHAAACIEAGLEFSEDTAERYGAFVDEVSPLVRAAIQQVCEHEETVPAFQQAVIRSCATRSDAEVRDTAFFTVLEGFAEGLSVPDGDVLCSHACDFVSLYFNRMSDLASGMPHIAPRAESPAVRALLMAAVVDCCGVDLDAQDKDRLSQDLHSAVTDPHASSYAARRFRSSFVAAWEKQGWPTFRDSTLTALGRAWYRARVSPGTLEEGAYELNPNGYSLGRFAELIQDYDSAMEYRRNR